MTVTAFLVKAKGWFSVLPKPFSSFSMHYIRTYLHKLMFFYLMYSIMESSIPDPILKQMASVKNDVRLITSSSSCCLRAMAFLSTIVIRIS